VGWAEGLCGYRCQQDEICCLKAQHLMMTSARRLPAKHMYQREVRTSARMSLDAAVLGVFFSQGRATMLSHRTGEASPDFLVRVAATLSRQRTCWAAHWEDSDAKEHAYFAHKPKCHQSFCDSKLQHKSPISSVTSEGENLVVTECLASKRPRSSLR
jgi:hypothetical protein